MSLRQLRLGALVELETSCLPQAAGRRIDARPALLDGFAHARVGLRCAHSVTDSSAVGAFEVPRRFGLGRFRRDLACARDGLREIVQAHSPKHTTPFMNLVLGQIESDAGKEGLREDLVLLTIKRW